MKNKQARDKFMAIIKEQAEEYRNYNRSVEWIKKLLKNPNPDYEIANKMAQEAAKKLRIEIDE
jgi:hypothetical protein